jgi:hypothetical protein
MARFGPQRHEKQTYNVTLRFIRVTFVLPRLSLRSDTVSLEERACRRFNVAGNNKTYLGLRVKFPEFLLEFYQIWSFLTDLPRSIVSNCTGIRPVGGSSLISVNRGTDGHHEADRPFSRLTRTRLKINFKKISVTTNRTEA